MARRSLSSPEHQEGGEPAMHIKKLVRKVVPLLAIAKGN
jgi:hypothetical protein